MEAAFGGYGLSPEVFWGMTPVEWRAMEQGKLKAQPGYQEPMSREEFEEMDRKFKHVSTENGRTG